jgi:hypothetical protein
MYSPDHFILNNIYVDKCVVCNNEWMLKGNVLSTIYQCPHYNETYVSYRLNPPYIYKETVEDDKSEILVTNEIEDTEILIYIQQIYQEAYQLVEKILNIIFSYSKTPKVNPFASVN